MIRMSFGVKMSVNIHFDYSVLVVTNGSVYSTFCGALQLCKRTDRCEGFVVTDD